jgi:transcriptional regulator with XRE-family HTH domain
MSEMKDRLKELRKTLNLKQREVAERLDVDVSLVGAWETAKQAIPSTRIYQLCKEYNVRREWLETGVGEMFEEKEERKLSEFSDRDIYLESMRRVYDTLPESAKIAFADFCRKLRDDQ